MTNQIHVHYDDRTLHLYCGVGIEFWLFSGESMHEYFDQKSIIIVCRSGACWVFTREYGTEAAPPRF